ncbi:MAG: PIN domain-containing protein [Myxococcota bacterium]
MSGGDAFFDTNVLLYLLSADVAKAQRAEEVLAAGGFISVQVLNEFVSVARRKVGMTIPEIREFLTTIRAVCRVCPLDVDTHDLGMDISERHGFALYDSQIIASAKLAGCRTVFSEDLQDGQTVAGVKVSNPFSPKDKG